MPFVTTITLGIVPAILYLYLGNLEFGCTIQKKKKKKKQEAKKKKKQKKTKK